MTDYAAPERIWLQEPDASEPWTNDTTWCQDKIHESDVEYVRRDVAEAENRKLREALRLAGLSFGNVKAWLENHIEKQRPPNEDDVRLVAKYEAEVADALADQPASPAKCGTCGGSGELCCEGDNPRCPPCDAQPCPACQPVSEEGKDGNPFV